MYHVRILLEEMGKPSPGDKVVPYIRSKRKLEYSEHIHKQEEAIADCVKKRKWSQIVETPFRDELHDELGPKLDLPEMDKALKKCREEGAWFLFINFDRSRFTDAFNRRRYEHILNGGKEVQIDGKDIIPFLKRRGRNKKRRQLPLIQNEFVEAWRKAKKISPKRINVLAHAETDTGERKQGGQMIRLKDFISDLRRSHYSDQKIADALNTIEAVTAEGKKWSKRSVTGYREKWNSEQFLTFNKVRLLEKRQEEYTHQALLDIARNPEGHDFVFKKPFMNSKGKAIDVEYDPAPKLFKILAGKYDPLKGLILPSGKVVVFNGLGLQHDDIAIHEGHNLKKCFPFTITRGSRLIQSSISALRKYDQLGPEGLRDFFLRNPTMKQVLFHGYFYLFGDDVDSFGNDHIEVMEDMSDLDNF